VLYAVRRTSHPRSRPGAPHSPLEVKSDLRRQRSRRHIVRPAEGWKKVIERSFVAHVDSRETQTPLVAFTVKDVVVPYAETKERHAR
jgi:hypothetical protein